MRILISLLLLVALGGPSLAQAPDVPALDYKAWPAQTLDAGTGLRIWEYPSADLGAFHMVILVGVGSRDENRKYAGIGHLLEHSLFLSTEERTEDELIKGLRREGGLNNGQTTVDWTAYWVSVPLESWEYGVDWLTELIAKPKFLESEVMREKGIVIEEIKTRHQHGARPVIGEILYGDHPLGHSVAGDEETVSAIEVEDVRSWYEANYRLDNMVVAFSGLVPSQACTERIQSNLSTLRSGSPPRVEHELKPNFGRSLIGTGKHLPDDRSGFLLVGHMIRPTSATDLATLLVADRLLSDAVQDEIRSNRGLAYSPTSELVICDGVWRLDCQIQVGERDNLPAVLEGAEVALKSLNAVAGEEFSRARDQVRSSLVTSGAPGLLRSVELTWALRNAGRLLDLDRALAKLELKHFTAGTKRLLLPEQQFVLSDSANIVQPGSTLMAFILTGLVIAVLSVIYLPRKLVRLWVRRQIKSAQERVQVKKVQASIRTLPAKVDVDELERNFGDYFHELDEKEKP